MKVDDSWVNRQLIKGLDWKEKIKFYIRILRRFIDKFYPSILHPRYYFLPSAGLSITHSLLVDFIEEELQREDISIGHSKILESKGYSSVKEELKSIIDRLPDFQAFIYMTDVWYRDHVLHQIRTATLGDYLLSQNFTIDNKSARLIDHICTLGDMNEKNVRKAWWITGLFHDIGIPLAKFSKNIEYLAYDLMNTYEKLNFKKLRDIPVIPHKKNESIIEKIYDKKKFKKYELDSFKKKAGIGSSSRGIDLDHGVISALIILASSPEIINLKKLYSNSSPYLIASQAIAIHNLMDIEVVFEYNPLGFLLVICDELQEWNRDIKIKHEIMKFDPKPKMVQLTKEIQLKLTDEEISAGIKFKDQKAKDKCGFQFDKLVENKKMNLNRLKSKHKIPNIKLKLEDFVYEGNLYINNPPADPIIIEFPNRTNK